MPEREEGLGGGAQQQRKHLPPMREGERAERRGEREDDVEVVDVEDPGHPLVDPAGLRAPGSDTSGSADCDTSDTLGVRSVDLSSLAGPASAAWYDPTNGQFTAIAGSPLANSGVVELTPPGANAAGDGDWVLVLETQLP